MPDPVLTPGTQLVIREVLHGAEWAHWPGRAIADVLDGDDRWWAPWDDWTPADGTIRT